MKNFRTLSTRSLLTLIAVVLAVAVAGTIAVAARGGSGATPPPKPLADAIHDAVTASAPAGITARIHFTNKLFPSGALAGQAGSALMSSADGRLWANANGGRLELQSDAGDAQITWNDTKVTVYDASSNTAYVADLPEGLDDDERHAHAAHARRDHEVPDRRRAALGDLRRDTVERGRRGGLHRLGLAEARRRAARLGRARVGRAQRHAPQARGVRAGLVVAGARARRDRHLVRQRRRRATSQSPRPRARRSSTCPRSRTAGAAPIRRR